MTTENNNPFAAADQVFNAAMETAEQDAQAERAALDQAKAAVQQGDTQAAIAALEALEAAQDAQAVQDAQAQAVQALDASDTATALGKLREVQAAQDAQAQDAKVASQPPSAIRGKPRPAPILSGYRLRGAVLREGLVAVFAGAGGSGKSKMALQIALQIAQAAPDRDTDSADRLWTINGGGRCLMVLYEDGPEDAVFRLDQQAAQFGFQEAVERVRIADYSEVPLFGIEETDAFRPQPKRLPALDLLEHDIKQHKPRLVVIDPAAEAFDGEPNDARQVRAFMRALGKLAKAHKLAVLVLAHSTKAALREGQKYDPGHVAGSAQWVNTARTTLTLTRDTECQSYNLAIGKCNHGQGYVDTELKEDGDYLLVCADKAPWGSTASTAQDEGQGYFDVD